MKFPWFIWIPRILLILILLFLALFSFDVFEGKASIWNKLLGLLIHNIPSLILLLLLILTWNQPLYGGIFIVLFAVVLTFVSVVIFHKHLGIDALIFFLPMLITAFLFILAHYKKSLA